jgi:hypothetical protein
VALEKAALEETREVGEAGGTWLLAGRSWLYISTTTFGKHRASPLTPFDFWSLRGEIPPPFESVAEKRWVRASPYTSTEKLPINVAFNPGIADR